MRSATQRARVLRRRLVTAAATLAGALLAYALFSGRIDEEIDAATVDEQRGYYLTTATLTEMGLDGSPRIVLRADSIEQRLPDGSVLLYNLAVDYQTAKAGAWTATSRRSAAACRPIMGRCCCRATCWSRDRRRAARP